MESDTERINRILLLWLELNRQMARVNPIGDDRLISVCEPWSSNNPNIAAIWEKLTRPENLLALEQWLCQSAPGRSSEWAIRALQTCRRRLNQEPGATADSDEPFQAVS